MHGQANIKGKALLHFHGNNSYANAPNHIIRTLYTIFISNTVLISLQLARCSQVVNSPYVRPQYPQCRIVQDIENKFHNNQQPSNTSPYDRLARGVCSAKHMIESASGSVICQPQCVATCETKRRPPILHLEYFGSMASLYGSRNKILITG
jgi:hypothetical protein